jgi:competence protein ComEC
MIAPVSEKYGDNENNYSIGVLVTYGETTFLFTGDAEEEAEEDILDTGIDIDCDVYKVAHHGSSTANTSAFLDAALPEYAVISCGEGNDYGHPHSEVLNELRTRGIKVFRTDEQGTIVATSDGKNITFNMSPDESWRSGSGVKVND